MAKVLVLGARGVLGRFVVQHARNTGHEVLEAGRSGPVSVDLTGDVDVHGASVVIHCAAEPFSKHERTVEVDAMAKIRHAAPEARIIYPSIVGVDRIPGFRYYQTKVAAEQALAAAGGNYAILRLTQFHEFADRFARMPIPTFPRHFQFQSLAATEAAAALVDLIEDSRTGMVGEMGGPEVIPLKVMVKQRMKQDGRRRPIVTIPMGSFSRDLKAGKNLCPDAAMGRITWQEHLAQN